MLKFKILAVKKIKGKDGREWFVSTLLLSDGDTFQVFVDHPVSAGDDLPCTVRKVTPDSGRPYLAVVPS